MQNIIFTKYSNDRDDKYNIRTDILIDENGKKTVRKKAMNESGKAHVQSIYGHYQKLSKIAEGTKIFMNSCIQKEDCVEFEFLKGQTFEQYLDKFLVKEDFNRIKEEIKAYINEVEKCFTEEKFETTKEFGEIFGEVTIPEKTKSGTVTNIDMVFANAIMREDGFEMIDYEWTFDFPIPFHYVVYRILHYYMEGASKRYKLREMGLYEMFHLTKEELVRYRVMEQHFQQYILGNTVPLRNLYHSISGSCLDVQSLAKKETIVRNENIQIYINRGNGYHEEESFYVRGSRKGDGSISFEFPIQGDVCSVRVDPMNVSGIVRVVNFYAYGDGCFELPYTSNGFQVFGDSIIFLTSDPQFEFTNLPASAEMISGELHIEVMEEGILKEMSASLTNQRDSMKEENERLTFELEQQREENLFVKRNYEKMSAEKEYIDSELAGLNQHYRAAISQRDAMQNRYNELFEEYQKTLKSTSVRMTKPLRFFGRIVKKVLKSNKVTWYFCKGIKSLLKNGPIETARKVKHKLHPQPIPTEGYHDIAFLTPEERKKQEETVFKTDVTFSVLVPLYNTPLNFLTEMIDSVVEQTYGKWELCLADGSDDEHAEVGETCLEYASKDKRIVYKKLEENKGISENTNACIRMATGNYIALFDHDDILHPSVLFENMCVIDRTGADYIYTDEATFEGSINHILINHFKPDFSVDNLAANNYICHFSAFKRSLFDKVGMFRHEYDGSQDHDMILRLTEQANRVEHIPKVLYYWRSHPNSVASDINSKTYAIDAGKRAVLAHLDRVKRPGTVESSRAFPTIFRIRYAIKDMDRVSIIIPNCDHVDDLRVCINSIRKRSTYSNYEIVIVENNSKEEKTFAYYEIVEKLENVRVLYYKGGFNYSAINNFAVSQVDSKYLLFLNNDTEVIEPMWIEELMMYAQRDDVAAVGAKLFYIDETIQHAGIVLAIGPDGVAGHAHHSRNRDDNGYMGKLFFAHDVTGVTAACMMVRREVFLEVGGFDEEFVIAYNDLDLCMKFRAKGYLNVFNPYAELYHYESKSRGYENTPEKQARFQNEVAMFKNKWSKELEAGDIYYRGGMY